MKELAEAFLLQLQNKNFSPLTIKGYREDLREFLDFCHRRKQDTLSCFTSPVIRSFLADLQNKEHPARNTVLRKIASLRSFTAYLLAQGKLDRNPFK